MQELMQRAMRLNEVADRYAPRKRWDWCCGKPMLRTDYLDARVVRLECSNRRCRRVVQCGLDCGVERVRRELSR